MSKFRTSNDKRAVVASRLSELFKDPMDTDELYRKILQLAGELVCSTSQSLFLNDEENSVLREVASIGERVDLIQFVPFELGSGLSAWVGKERRPIKVSGIGRRTREVGACFLAAPLLADDALVGVLTFANEGQPSFSDEDVVVAESIATQIAAGLERRLFRQQTSNLDRRIEKLSSELNSVRVELIDAESKLAKATHTLALVERIDAPLAVLQHVLDYLEQEYRERDVKLLERLSVISDQSSRIGAITEKIRRFSNHCFSTSNSATPAGRV